MERDDRTLSTVHNTATVLQLQGDHPKALGWYRRALDALRRSSEKTILAIL